MHLPPPPPPPPPPHHPAIPVQCKIKNSREKFLITTTRPAFLREFNVGVKIGRPDPSSQKERELLLIQSTPFIADTVGTLTL